MSKLCSDADRDLFLQAAKLADDEALVAATHCSFVDRMVLDAVGRRVRQVVLIGSGMDTRAFRLDVPPQLKIIEVEEPEVHQAKEEVLSGVGERARCSLRRVGAAADFPATGGLPVQELRGVLDPRRPSLVVVEDLLSLWTETAQARALSEANAMAGNGSRLLAQLRPQHPQPAPDVHGIRRVLRDAGWERVDVVGHKALKTFFPRAPADELAVLVVAEKGAPVTPRRPPAARGGGGGGASGAGNAGGAGPGAGPREATF